MAELQWTGLAFSSAQRVDQLTLFFLEAYQNGKDLSKDLEKTRLALTLASQTFRSIKAVLFGQDQSPNHGIFKDLDPQEQLDIIQILRLFHESLESQCSLVYKTYEASQPSLLAITDPSFHLGSQTSTPIFRRLRWGFRDKAKMDKVIRELDCWNDRLFRMVQLKVVQRDQGARYASYSRGSTPEEPASVVGRILGQNLLGGVDDLGLSNDLTVARMASDNNALVVSGPSSLEITTFELYEKARVLVASKPRRLVQVQGQPTLLEYKEFIPDRDGRVAAASHEKIKILARILHEATNERYRTLTCNGYYIHKSHFVLVFSIPPAVSPKYTTLAAVLRDSSQLPGLDQRFMLARRLCAAVAHLHSVGWVHKSIRSENILFFYPNAKDMEPFDTMYLSGWEYSRPESGLSSAPPELSDIENNIYRHSEQWGLPTVRFNWKHDVYSLGVILLEIGRWKPALEFHPTKFRNCGSGDIVQGHLIRCATDAKLGRSMGRRYQEIVRWCLQGPKPLDDGTVQVMTVQDFQTEVLDVLDEIVCHL